MRWRAGLLLCAGLGASGCMPTMARGALPPARPGRGPSGLVVAVDGALLEPCRRQILGVVDVSVALGEEPALLERVRQLAAARGGDRVVDVSYQRRARSARLSGMIARCSTLLSGRDYVVVRSLSASAPLGNHTVALAALGRQLRKMHAQLMVDVDYEQGDDATGTMRITGKAARYVQHGWGMGDRDSIDGYAGDGNDPPPRRRRAPVRGPLWRCGAPSDPSKEAGSPSDPSEPAHAHCEIRF